MKCKHCGRTNPVSNMEVVGYCAICTLAGLAIYYWLPQWFLG